MKIAILADTHFGCRSNSVLFQKQSNKFYSDIFFPELNKRNIQTVIHLGDVWDSRKSISTHTMKETRENFLEPLSQYDTHMIVGNHDTFFTSTNRVNSLDEVCREYGFRIYTDSEEILLSDGTKVIMVPWICQDNHEKSMNDILTTDAQICMGHLQIQGFEMYLGTVCHDGLQASIFDKFECTFSGHFHKKSSVGNIHYLGTPYQWSWNDYGEVKGFHIFDTKTRTLEFIQNPNQMFHKVFYDDTQEKPNLNMEKLIDSYVKIIVKNKKNPYEFDMFKSKLDVIAHDVKVIDDTQKLLFDKEEISLASDTFSILKETLNDENLNVDKVKLEAILKELYDSAIHMEV